MKLRFNKNVEFPFEDFDGSEHMIMTIKKGLEIEVSGDKIGKGHSIDFEVYKYDRKYIDFKILKESTEYENDPEFYYNEICFIEIDEDDVEEVK
jgi:hypothetical protein